MTENKHNIPLQGRIVGFHGELIPMAITTIYTNETNLFIRYSSGSSIAIGDNEQEIHATTKKMPDYFELPNMGTIKAGEYAYALSKEEVIVDNPENITRRLEKELQEAKRPQKDLKMIAQFLESNKKSKKPDTLYDSKTKRWTV